MKRKQIWIAFFSGVLFSIGLAFAGMTQPQKVIAFLDVSGNWDPSLAFVMVGAIAVYSIGFRIITQLPHPLFDKKFELPKKKDLDRNLIIGSILFGVGWGLVGFCPAPALTALVAFRWEPTLFVVAMLGGMGLYTWTEKKT
jgi:uncharacterized membrane protein YedE/YeeE